MDVSSGSESSPVSARAPPFEYVDSTSGSHSPLTLMWINIPIKPMIQMIVPPTISFMSNTQLTPLTIHLAALGNSQRHSYSDLGEVNSEVIFHSPSLVSHCLWTVWKKGNPFPFHREIVKLDLCSSSKHGAGWDHLTRLVPGFWSTICDDPCKSFYNMYKHN